MGVQQIFQGMINFFKPNGQNGNNNRQNLLMVLSVLAMVGILLMLLSSKVQTTKNAEPPVTPGSEVATESKTGGEDSTEPVFGNKANSSSWEDQMENKLEKMLSQIEGVGKVEVTITLEQGPEYVYNYNSTVTNNRTEEKDSTGGTRSVTDSSDTNSMVVARTKEGEERPIIRTEKAPTIQGVGVVAEGAENPRVNTELHRAVSTVLGVELSKICVFSLKGR